MCGFCIEGTEVLSFLQSELMNTDFKMQSVWVPLYVQEAHDLFDILQRTQELKGVSGSLDMALCRLYEVYLSHGFQASLFDAIVSVYHKDAIAQFFGDHIHCGADLSSVHQGYWSRLWSQEIYSHPSAWEDLVKDPEGLVAESESLLAHYCDVWVLAQHTAQPDPTQNLGETGVVAPIENKPEKDWDTFYCIFPALFFALSVLRRYRPHSDVIRVIALNDPHDAGGFLSYGLWLQRQAFLACVQAERAPFIEKHHEDIRYQLIAYVLLKLDMTPEERAQIRNLVSRYPFGILVWDRESVMDLIDAIQGIPVLGQKARLD